LRECTVVFSLEPLTRMFADRSGLAQPGSSPGRGIG
jgi:hypothetical protein